MSNPDRIEIADSPISLWLITEASGRQYTIHRHQLASNVAQDPGVKVHALTVVATEAAAMAATVPAGWQVMPTDSTAAMQWAFERANVRFDDGTGRTHPMDPASAFKARYAALLAAAPQAPVADQPTGPAVAWEIENKHLGPELTAHKVRADEATRLGLTVHALGRLAAKLTPIDGDLLPPIGSRVFIRHGRDDDAHACRVTGYYAWSDLGGNKSLSRVFVCLVYEGTTTENARMLCDCYPTAEAALAVPRAAVLPDVPRVLYADEPFDDQSFTPLKATQAPVAAQPDLAPKGDSNG